MVRRPTSGALSGLSKSTAASAADGALLTRSPPEHAMHVESLSALVFTSAAPDRLAAFYREHLGIPFEHQGHGPIRDHLEAWLGGEPGKGIHFAILKGRGPGEERGAVAPTFRVADLDRAMEALARAQVRQVRGAFDLGEGKRLASYADVDGNVFSLIEVRQ
jgi:predicted enzyme related to lactoylglutathione lyase